MSWTRAAAAIDGGTCQRDVSARSGHVSEVSAVCQERGHCGRMTYSIVAEGLVKRFDRAVALDGIDLAVRSGSVFGLLGPNGADSPLLN